MQFRITGPYLNEKMEKLRKEFRAIVQRLSRSTDETPSAKDAGAMRDLAESDLPEANYMVGPWQLNGKGVWPDKAAGLTDIQEAADEQYGPALFFLGNAKLHGDFCQRIRPRGSNWLAKRRWWAAGKRSSCLGKCMWEAAQTRTKRRSIFIVCRHRNAGVPVSSRRTSARHVATKRKRAATGRGVIRTGKGS